MAETIFPFWLCYNRPMMPNLLNKHYRLIIFLLACLTVLIPLLMAIYYNSALSQKITSLAYVISSTKNRETKLKEQLTAIKKEINDLKNQDQVKINKELREEIDNIQKSYKKSLTAYEGILELRELGRKTNRFEELFATVLDLLSKRNYASAEAVLKNLELNITEEKAKMAAIITPPPNISVISTPPDSGYRRQTVPTDMGNFLIDIISADLNSTRVIVDTASESDCSNNCPTLPLAEYVARNGAFAGINGSYFCPAEYPQCAGKTNSFDTLLMNKNKKYFNSDNNVYSTVPAVIFSGSTARFVTQSLEWGRDTGVDAVIANHPLLVFNSALFFTGGGDSKQTSRGNRSFVANKANTVYIGVVHNASVAQSAKVLYTLGLTNALNLDDGGSTALWYGGYKVGPGRNIPNALLLIRK